MRKQFTIIVEYNLFEDERDPVDAEMIDFAITETMISLDNDGEIEDFTLLEVQEL